MHRGIGVRGLRIKAGPNNPAPFTMLFHALADEFRPGLKDEISFHSFPDEMELVPFGPHVHPRASHAVFLADGIVGGGTGNLRRADIRVSVKFADGMFLRKSWKDP